MAFFQSTNNGKCINDDDDDDGNDDKSSTANGPNKRQKTLNDFNSLRKIHSLTITMHKVEAE